MPETRSKGRAPASRVYSSTPVPQQVHFPSRQRLVRTYGKQNKGVKRALRQQTITQIDFLEPVDPEELEELEAAERENERRRKRRRRTDGDDGVGIEGIGDVEEDVGREKGKGKKGRRKTEGDGPSSSFHTQTLTQLYGDRTILDSEDEDGDDIGPGAVKDDQGTKSPSVIPQTPLKNRTRLEIPSSQPSPCTPIHLRYSPLGPRASPLKSRSTNVGSPLATAKEVKRVPRALVIQDSFASGVTMESGTSQASAGGVRGGDGSQRPGGGRVQTGQTTPQAGSGTRSGSEKRVFQRVEIPDTDDEDDGDGFEFTVSGDMTALTVPESPTKRLSPGTQAAPRASETYPREVQGRQSDGSGSGMEDDFKFTPAGDVTALTVPDSPTKQLGSRQTTPKPSKSSSQRAPDNQLGNAGSGREKEETQPHKDGPRRGEKDQFDKAGSGGNDRKQPGKARSERQEENSYPIGPDTQFAMDFIASTEENTLRHSRTPQSSQPARPSFPPSSRPVQKAPTPKTTPKRPRKKTTVVQFSSPQVSFEDEVRSSADHKTQAYTQMGSQRVDFDIIRSMPAPTGRSDAFISLHPEHAAAIASGTKDHEFRTWRLPFTVCRVWIYVTRPESRVRYMACIGPAKEAGQITDERGTGNAEFNKGESAKFAYEILELYELNNPVSLNRAKENGWFAAPPQKFAFVPPVVASQLQANLRCRVLPWGEGEDDSDSEEEGQEGQKEAEEDDEFGERVQDSQPRESQEVEAQLMSDIAYSTQRPVDSPSQGVSRLTRDNLASSALQSSRSQLLAAGDGEEDKGDAQEAIPSSQATTASGDSVSPAAEAVPRPADSVPQPADSVPRPANPSSSMPVFHDSGSPVRVPEGDWGISMSQLAGDSQLLSGTLLTECAPPEDYDL